MPPQPDTLPKRESLLVNTMKMDLDQDGEKWREPTLTTDSPLHSAGPAGVDRSPRTTLTHLPEQNVSEAEYLDDGGNMHIPHPNGTIQHYAPNRGSHK